MFCEIHKKIKGVAAACAVIGVIAIPVGLITEILLEANGLYIGTVSGGGLVLLLQSWFVYGFGQLIENSQRTADMLALSMQNAKSAPSTVALDEELPDL